MQHEYQLQPLHRMLQIALCDRSYFILEPQRDATRRGNSPPTIPSGHGPQFMWHGCSNAKSLPPAVAINTRTPKSTQQQRAQSHTESPSWSSSQIRLRKLCLRRQRGATCPVTDNNNNAHIYINVCVCVCGMLL